MRHGLLALAFLAAFSACCSADSATNVPAGWQTHRSPDYGFEISYPKSLTFYPGRPDLHETQVSVIGICDDTTVACFVYNGSEYKGTNFEAAGISVNVLRDAKTEQDCNKIRTGQDAIKTQTIHGNQFHYGETGEGGLGSSRHGPAYRVFYQNVCFEVLVAIAQSTFENYEPGTIRRFDPTKLEQLLDKIVHTFQLMGPVEDGAEWNVFRDTGCGGSFEYPEGSTVQTTIEYSVVSDRSNGVTCSRHFTHQGRHYTISTKTNLGLPGRLDAWLKSSGYPGLSAARLTLSSGHFTEYDADPYCYIIYDQSMAYILSVSDASHHVVSPKDDEVFRHWLNSFKG